MARILAIGITTLDIINLVEEYPAEDSKIRILQQSKRRGGNATNTLVVLSQLGHQCSWAGSLVDEPDAQLIRADLARYNIDTHAVEWLDKGKLPTSYITLSQRTASRTIVHYRDLPEYSFKSFRDINLQQFDWLHFEGRNVDAVHKMLERTKILNPRLPCSVEIEKQRPEIEQLFVLPDLLIFSQDYASRCGFNCADHLFRHIRKHNRHATLICTWGEQGAYALDPQDRHYHAPAFPPPHLHDTLAAGDVFNAGLIHALARQQTLEISLIEASRLAGHKCGQYGIDGLAT